MHLQDLGYTEEIDQYIRDNRLEAFTVGRITAEHKERYVVRTETGELTAEITGNLRFSARDRSDFPAVGDWVTLTVFDDSLGIINAILPRKTVLERRAVGKFSEKQIIAANIDVAFIMQAVDQDFNINRLERYLAICLAAKVTPVVLLSKIDLITPNELEEKLSEIRKRQKNARIIPLSNESKKGIDDLLAVIEKGKTYCVMGSSGVGKSTLINNLSGEAAMQTSAVSTSTKKGRHTTSHRELFILEKAALVRYTPGMREIGITESAEETIDELAEYAQNCKYKDCTHIHEEGCAVIAAVEKRQKDKALGTMYKEVTKHHKKKKF